MAKKNTGAASKQTKKQTRQEAQQMEAQRQRDLENARKTRRLSNAFLYAVMTILALLCLYVLISTCFFPSASVSALRSDLLFVSLISIPYLIAAGAFLVRKLRAKRRAEASSKVRSLSTAIFILIMLGAILLCTTQLFGGQVDASGLTAWTQVVEAARETGLEVREPDEVLGFRALLEYSQETELTVGETKVLVNYHTGLTAGLLERQVRADYAAFSLRETEGDLGAVVTVWDPAPGSEKPRAAFCSRKGSQILIVELSGPEEELRLLLPALEAAASDGRNGR